MLKEPPKDRKLHPDLVSITQEMVDIYPKGHSDGKIRAKFYRLLQERSKLVQSLMERGECDEEGLIPVTPMIDSKGVYESFMTVFGDEEKAICYTIDVAWEAGKSPRPFKEAVLEIMRRVKKGRFPELSDSDKILLQSLLMRGNPHDPLEVVCEQVYRVSKQLQAQQN